MEHVDYKVPGGKMLRIDVEITEDRIEKIKIRGDFFIHPEDSLRDLEESLYGVGVNDIVEEFKDYIESKGVDVIGFDGEDLKTAVSKAKDGN
ncbi:MAG: hypothetical protein ACLFSS_04025 [Candidatus Aenigmatarchaeota archaeon]